MRKGYSTGKEEATHMFIFQTRSFWREMQIPRRLVSKRFKYFLGDTDKKIEDRKAAMQVLMKVTSTIQEEMVNRIV